MTLVKIINTEELKQIKESYEKDFPKNERIPFFYLKNLIKKQKIEVLFLKENEDILGYIVAVKSKNGYILIEYFAILEKYRSKGYGSICLEFCKNYYQQEKGIFLEVEKQNLGKNEQENKIREKRVKFYEKNGFQKTNVVAILYRVVFDVMIYINEEINEKEIKEAGEDVYSKIRKPWISKKHCKFAINK